MNMASSQSVLICPIWNSLRQVVVWMLIKVAELLSSGVFGAKMRISMWTRSHQRGSDKVSQAGVLDAVVRIWMMLGWL